MGTKDIDPLTYATETNVPQHTANGKLMPSNHRPVSGVEILIVTHNKDLPWLEYCLRSIRKHCSGFSGITVAHPNAQAHEFKPFAELFPIQLHGYEEVAGKGMLQHMVKMAQADWIAHPSTKYVCHLDADCVFHTPTTPADYFTDDRPDYFVRSWESLTTEDPTKPGGKVISDCAQWRKPTADQIGFDPEVYSMCRHPTILPVAFYPLYRAHIERHQQRPFEQYMLSGRNTFPQDRMDWTAMGAVAYKYFTAAFNWIDIERQPYPKDRQKTYWSHGGVTPAIVDELEGFVK